MKVNGKTAFSFTAAGERQALIEEKENGSMWELWFLWPYWLVWAYPQDRHRKARTASASSLK